MFVIACWVVSDLFSGCMFQVFELAFVQCCCLKEYTNWYRKHLQLLPTEKHLKPCKVFKRMLLYRQLQTLSRLYNMIQQDVFIVALLNLALFVFIVAVYALTYMGAQISLPHLLFFANVVLLLVLVILICFGTFAGLHGQSMLLVEFMRKVLPCRNRNASTKRLVKMYARSFREFKVNIGEMNFVEKCTPMVMLDFCFGQIVDLLLIA